MNRTFTLLLSVPVMVIAGFAQTPVVPPGSVVNGATFGATEPVAPGSLISIFGTQLSSGTANADTIPLSAKLAGTSVTVTGPAGTFDAPLLFVEPGQINAQLPWECFPPAPIRPQ
jgi:uncharacterized protein (TIGR03437 family)